MFDGIGQRARTAVDRLVPSGGIAEQTVKSGLWRGVMDIGGHALQLIVLIVLARLLDPRAFGLVGITLVTLATLSRFTRPGFNQAIIHDIGEDVDRYLNTKWSVELVRGGIIALLLYFSAPVVAAFFNEPRVIVLLRIMVIVPVLDALANPAIVFFEKDLDFHKQFALNMGSSVLQFGVSICIAIVDPTVWALVFGHIASGFGKLVGSYLLHGYRPWPRFDRAAAAEMFGFGKWITASSFISFVISNGDDFVIGRLLPTASLGLYQYGYRLGRYSTHEVSSIIAEVMFPAFSKIQDDLGALREAFFHTLLINSIMVFPMTVGAVVVAPLFVRGFLGTQWIEAIPVFQLIAVYGMLSAAVARGDVLMKAVGKPDYRAKIRVLWLVGIAVSIVPLTNRFGITGTALAVVGSYLLTEIPATVYFISSYLEVSYRRYLWVISYPLLASLLMGGVTVAVRENVSLGSSVLEFFLVVPIGVVVYVTTIIGFNYLFDWTLDETYTLLVDTLRG